MRRALEYVKAFDGVIAQHAQDPRLTEGAQMNEGAVSAELGLAGWPAVAEESIIARDVLLAEHVGSRLHVCHLSTAGSVDIIRWAKRRGVDVTAEVTPHHLLLTDELARGYDARFKVNPPLRREEDVLAVREGLADGTIDIVATDHAPHPAEAKACEWHAAANGMVGLESALRVVQQAMVDTGLLTWGDVARVMSREPARIGRLAGHGTPLTEGQPASLTFYDPAPAPHLLDRRPARSQPELAVPRPRAAGRGALDAPPRAPHRRRRRAPRHSGGARMTREGALAVMIAVAVVLLAALAWAWWRRTRRDAGPLVHPGELPADAHVRATFDGAVRRDDRATTRRSSGSRPPAWRSARRRPSPSPTRASRIDLTGQDRVRADARPHRRRRPVHRRDRPRRRAGRPHPPRPGAPTPARSSTPTSDPRMPRPALSPTLSPASSPRPRREPTHDLPVPDRPRRPRARGRHPPRRPRLRRPRHDARRGRLRHRHDRLPGDAHRSLVRRPDRAADRAAHRQHRHERRGPRVAPHLGVGLHRARPLARRLQLARRRVARRRPRAATASSASAASTRAP